MALDRYGDVLPRSILKPRSAGDGNPVYVALSFADEPDLIRLQDAMRRSGIKAEWQDPGLFHCSLLIVEDATDEQVDGLLDGLSLPVRFWVEVASLGTFEADDIPLIANVVANPALIRLQQEFGAAASRIHLPVFEFFRATSWKPHITLGYDSDADIETLPAIPSIIKLRAEGVLLMRDDYNVVRRILLPETMPDRAFVEVGGEGSGHFGHAGIPGHQGGSLPSGEVAEEGTPVTVGRNPWESTYHRPDGTLDMEAIGRDVARAVAERPSRESHGRTAVNAFFLVNGRIVPWDKWETIPSDEMSQAIAVHSHSADNWQQYRQMHNEGKPETFAPLNSADIALMFRNFTLHRMGAASIIIMGDGRMESLEILPDTDARAVRMREARLDPILNRNYAERLAYHDLHRDDPNYDTNQQERELLHAFANQYGLGYQEGRWRDDPLVARHYGPGPHPGTGTPQSVHGGGGISGEARLVSGIGPRRAGSRARYKAVIAADGIAALAAMPQTQTWRPAWEGLEAIDQVHRMPDYMPDLLHRTTKPGQLPFERSRSESRAGGYWQLNGDGAKKIGIDLTEAGYGAGQDPAHPQMTTVHEVGHFLDNVLFGDPYTGGRASMGRGARVGPSGNVVVNLNQQFEDVIVAIRESVDYQMLLGQNLGYFTVEGLSGHFQYPARAAMRVRQPVEMFARGYAQWVALRSGNSTMRTQIDYRNELADRGAPRLQWDWRNFVPIAGAYDRLFQAAGLLRSTP